MTAALLGWGCVSIAGLMVSSVGGLGAELLDSFAGRKLEALCRLRRDMSRYYAVIDHKDQAIESSEYLRMIGTVMFLVGGTVTLFLASQQMIHGLTHGQLIVWALSAGGVMMLIHTWLPVAVTRFASRFVLFHSWPFWRAVTVVFSPLSIPGLVINGLFRRVSGEPTSESEDEESLEDEIRMIVEEGSRKKYFDPDVKRMISGVMTLHERSVESIMTRRSNIDGIDQNWSWDRVFETIISAGRTRFPVYRESLDDIVGVLYVKDLLPLLTERQSFTGSKQSSDGAGNETIHLDCSMSDIVRRPWMVPEEKTVESMLREFLASRSHMAIVLDGRQQTTGVVTIEDALEEIVGEIVDESDPEEPLDIESAGGDVVRVNGRARIDDINEATGWDLPESDDYETIAGYVLFNKGVFPESGATVPLGDFEVRVLEASERKIDRVEIWRTPDRDAKLVG